MLNTEQTTHAESLLVLMGLLVTLKESHGAEHVSRLTEELRILEDVLAVL